MGHDSGFRLNNTNAIISLIAGIAGWALFALSIMFGGTFGAFFTLATFGIGLFCLIPLLCTIGFIPPIGWIIAVLLGHKSLTEIRVSDQSGRGIAIAGLVMGYSGFGIYVFGIIAIVLILLFGGSLPILDEILRQMNS